MQPADGISKELVMQAQMPTTPAPGPTPIALPGNPSAADIYQALKAQHRELSDQMSNLQGQRSQLTRQIERTDNNDTRTVLQRRLTDVDQRISALDKQIAQNDASVAQAAAIPGAVVVQPPPVFIRRGPPEEAFVLGGIFMIVVLFPLSVALARRIWRRGAAAIASLPAELSERLQRIEEAVDAIAVEVERVGENQRYVTSLVSGEQVPRALGAGAAEPIDLKHREALPTYRK
jgi:exonuclease VII large subunit